MKNLIFVFAFFALPLVMCAQKNSKLAAKPDATKKVMLVEASCGQCQFGMDGSGCDLAIRFDDKSYYVTGSNLNDHGDAHAHDGFCSAIRKAEVQGEVVDSKFKLSYFKLVSPEKNKKPK
ncbi:MAG: DUF6370 family protein [Saprospiraceae bacterium]